MQNTVRVLAFAFAFLVSISAALAQTKPNIVVFVLDDAADLNGLTWTKANIADQGVSIERFITNTPLCGPSRALTLRGQYAQNTGILTNADSAKFFSYKYGPGQTSVFQQTIESDTAVTRLKAVGYRTGHFGKHLNGWGSANITGPFPPNPPGWDVHMATVLNGPDGNNGPTAWKYFRVIKNGALVNDFTVANGGGYEPYEVLKHAVSFIRSTPGNQPLFMMVHARMPHTPSAPAPGDVNAPVPPLFYPPSYGEQTTVPQVQSFIASNGWAVPFTPPVDDYIRGEKEKRYRSMLYADYMMQVLNAEMIAADREPLTYYFVFSDNGWMQGEHGMVGGKGLGYREAISNTALYIKGPQVWPHVESERIGATVDLAPTWLRIAGLPPAPYMDGSQLHPLMYNNQAAPWRTAMLAQNWQEFYWNAIVSDDHWKLIVWQNGYLELYDTLNDEWERTNLAYDPAHQSDVTRLRTQIAGLRTCKGQVKCKRAEKAYVPMR